MSAFEFEDEQNEDIRELVERYENAVRTNGSVFMDQDNYESLIEFYELKGRFNNALAAAELALEQHPFSSILLLKKAQILFELKNCKEALEVLDTAELCDSTETGIFLLRAEILSFLSEYEKAIDILEQLIKTADEEDMTDIYLQMADVFEEWEKYYEVFECLKLCLMIDPENEEALNRINYCMEITEKYEESRVFLEKLIDEQPYSEFAWYNLSCALRGLGKYDEAIEALEYVLAINEDLNFAYQDIAELHLRKKDYTKAIESLKDYEARFEADDDIYFLKGQCHEAMLENKMARYYYKKALHCNPNYAEAYFRIGDTYKVEDNWAQAWSYFTKASDLEKQEYEYLLAAAEAAHVLEREEDAIETAERAIDVAPTRFESYLLMAHIFLYAGDVDTALELLDKGIVFCKSTIELRFGRVGVLFFIGHRKEGIIELMKLMAEAPGKEIFMLYMNPDVENDPDVADILQTF